jgi:hypothetical protein
MISIDMSINDRVFAENNQFLSTASNSYTSTSYTTQIIQEPGRQTEMEQLAAPVPA